MRWVIENFPDGMLRRLRDRAARAGLSPERVLIDMVERQLDMTEEHPPGGNFDDLCGALGPDPELDRMIAEQRRPDPKLWS